MPRSVALLRGLLKRLIVVGALVIALRLTGCMERLFYHPTVGPTPPPRGVESVTFESADGTRLSGWWFAGHQDGEGLLPTVVHVHGNAGNIQDHEWFSRHLPPAGFNVFLFDYRGFGASEGRVWTRDALIEDTRAAVAYVLERPDVDADRLGVYGQSLGGAIAINVMADTPAIRAAVFESPFESWRTVAASAISGEPPGFIGRALAWMLISDKRRPLDSMSMIDRPVLILHGTADDIVPHAHGRRLAAANPNHVTLVSLDGGGHNTLKETHVEVEPLMTDFLARHLAPDRD